MLAVFYKIERTLMLLQVLQSVSQMLADGLKDVPEKPAGDLGILITNIRCAKTLLDKVIEIEELKGQPPQRPRSTVPVTEEVGYVVDAPNGVLKKISFPDGRELAQDAMIEINGVAMEYSKAIGQKCKTGRVL